MIQAIQQSPDKARAALRRRHAELNLAEFIRQAWHTVEPATPYEHGRHIEAICAHLEAVTAGKIGDLLINIPPGFAKSLLVGVFWPAWVWTTRPEKRFVFTSHKADLSTRDSQRCRTVIQSEWYQANWGLQVQICSDQNVKTRFQNTASGYRIADIVNSGTGERADYFVADDPHSLDDAGSPAMLANVRTWWDETVTGRAANPREYHRIIIMQRVAVNDLAGHVLSKGGYEHLCLPMKYEPDRRCKTSIFEDWRTTTGELLWPERMNADMVAAKEKEFGSYAVASQYQQRPTPRGGGRFKRDWFGDPVKDYPADCSKVRFWDMAATEQKPGNDPDWTVGAKVGLKGGVWYIIDIKRTQSPPLHTQNLVSQTAAIEPETPIRMEQEPGSSGKTVIDLYARQILVGRDFAGVRSTGSKETRANPLIAAAEAGNVKLVESPWNAAFLDEAENFPYGDHDDQIDAVAGAMAQLRDLKPVFIGFV